MDCVSEHAVFMLMSFAACHVKRRTKTHKDTDNFVTVAMSP
jgi:hypothetical protein